MVLELSGLFYTDFESCLFQVLPVRRIGFGHHLRICNAHLRETDGCRCKSHCHTVVFVGVYHRLGFRFATLTFPTEYTVLFVAKDIAEFIQLVFQCSNTVCLFYFQTLQAGEAEGDA